MKKIISVLISIICVVSIFTTSIYTAFAQDHNAEITQEDIDKIDIDENYHLVGVDYVYDESLEVMGKSNSSSTTFADVIAHSANVQKAAGSYSGSFTSDKFKTEIPGYKYQIKFDWTAGVESGNYVFSKVSNYRIETYANYLLLGLTWEYYSYRIAEKRYSFNNSRRIINCYVTYVFTLRDKISSVNTTTYDENFQSFSLDSLL